jgi:putative transposase
MPNYRRNRVEGGSYFFTVNLRDRRSDLLVANIDALRDAVRTARALHPFHIDEVPVRWQMIKARFSRSVPWPDSRRASLVRKRESGIWQRRYWEHTIRDDQDYAVHMDYIHFNPVKHGLAAHPADWPFSSFGRCVALAMYPRDWAENGAEPPDAGERR